MRLRFRFGTISLLAIAACAAGLGQTPLAFEVATVKPAAPLDMAKLAAEVQAGHMPKLGASIDANRAQYIYVSLRDLISLAWKVQPSQVSGPDWLSSERFDIVAKMPEGSKRADAPEMLQTLLKERFQLSVHKDKAEHPVLAIVVAKGGPKLKESNIELKPIDETAPLADRESQMEGPDGPIRMKVSPDGSATMNLGLRGRMSYHMDPATRTFHMDGDGITMSAFADMLTQFSRMGGAAGKNVVDMTDLKGHYKITMEFSLNDLIQMARSAGMAIPNGPGGPGGGAPVDAASDPSGTASSVNNAVHELGLRLESRKAPVEQLIVDHAEKTPAAN